MFLVYCPVHPIKGVRVDTTVQITLKSIEFRYGTQKLVEVAEHAIEPQLFRRRRGTGIVQTTTMARADVAIFRCSIDKFVGAQNAEPIIEVTVPFQGDLALSARLVKAELIRLGGSIASDEMDFGALESAVAEGPPAEPPAEPVSA